MGQVFLGFRSLIVKTAVFVVMAAALAWALGGTLWPRAETSDLPAVSFGGEEWFWRAVIGGSEPGQLRWHLMHTEREHDPREADDREWAEVAGPLVADAMLYYGGRLRGESNAWRLERRSGDGRIEAFDVIDRLELERQLVRVAEGLAVDSRAAMESIRARVLRPPSASP